MKKKIFIIMTSLLFGSVLVGCGNQDFFDTNYTYDRAIIRLADDTIINTKIISWSDYDGEQLQITAQDGTIYLTNSFRCDLIKD